MAEDVCPHDGDPHSCPPCQRARRGPEPSTDEGWTTAFPAAYRGQCRECGLPIYVGQMIRMNRSTRQTIHGGCAT